MKESLIGGLAILALVGCHGKMDSDPLRDQPENVRQGIPPHEKSEEDRSPVPRDAMRLEIEPKVANFVEGEFGQVAVKADILSEGKEKFVLSVKNPPEGARFDSTTGKFSWTPPTDMVIGDGYMEVHQLTVQMSTLEEPVMSIIRSFPLFVRRNTVHPEIVQILDLPDEMMEGERKTFRVQVRDLDSSDGSLQRFKQPYLTVVEIEDGPFDGSSLVRLAPSRSDDLNPKQLDPNDPNLWTYKLIVSTVNKELTSGQKRFKFGLIATSRFGLPSQTKAVTLPIVSEVPQPLTTWPDEEIEFKANQTQVLAFDLYAPMGALSFSGTPQGDGDLDFPKINKKCNESLPGTAECKCKRAMPWRYRCTMTWTPPDIQADGRNYYPIAFSVVNRNRYKKSKATEKKFFRYVRVVPSIKSEGGML